MNCHGKNTLQPINKSMDFLNSCRISGHFETRFTTIAQIEQILQESKDPKIQKYFEHRTGLFSCDTRRISNIDSLDGLTFRKQLISILFVVPTGQHLHAINTNKC